MGEIASLLTSVCWVLSMMSFTAGGKRVGSQIVNRTRLIFGFLLLGALNLILFQELIPFSAAPDRWMWLGLSGLVGLVIGDAFLFQSLLWIGPRRSLLIMASVPVLNTLLAWLFLDESLTMMAIVGISTIMIGILIVVSEKNGEEDKLAQDKKHFVFGLLFAVLGVVGQSTGMIFAKLGVHDGFPALSGTLMRVIIANVAMLGIALINHQIKPSYEALKANRKALFYISLGALFGPFLGIWLSLVGLQKTDVGVASTLQALAPVLMLPISHFVYKEKISLRAIVGTIVAVIGVGVIFLLA